MRHLLRVDTDQEEVATSIERFQLTDMTGGNVLVPEGNLLALHLHFYVSA